MDTLSQVSQVRQLLAALLGQVDALEHELRRDADVRDEWTDEQERRALAVLARNGMGERPF